MRLDALDQQIKVIKEQIETTKEEVVKKIDIAQFNIISAQLKDPVTQRESLSKEYDKHRQNRVGLKNSRRESY